MVEVAVQGVPVQAVVDTGAEVNGLSKRVYDELDPRLPIKQHVTMTQAGDNAKMNGFIVGPVEIQLGSTGYCGDVYVASLKDQMLLGMEFLHQRKARLDLENRVMTLDRDTVPMTFGRAEGPLETQVLTVQCKDRDVSRGLFMARKSSDETTRADADPDPGEGPGSLEGAIPSGFLLSKLPWVRGLVQRLR
jgi:predicted aspartyl protease